MSSLNLNKVVLAGRLTADPELKTTQGGISTVSFTLAVNRRGKDDNADFIKCVAWRQTAEFISHYFAKGSSLCVTGAIQTRKWTDKNGQTRYETEVSVDEATFVESKKDESFTDKFARHAGVLPQETEENGDLPF